MEKEYKVEYKALFQFRKDEGAKSWKNALPFLNENKRVTNSLEEAERALEIVKRKFNKGARVETDYSAGFGISTEVDETTAHKLTITRTRIIKRQVTEWEEV